MYSAFEGFDESDLVGTLTAINSEIEKLPGRYSDLWDLFKTVKHFYDEEAYELLLADESLREEFYDRLADFGKKRLALHSSCEKFLTEVDEKILSRYKGRSAEVSVTQGVLSSSDMQRPLITGITSQESKSFWTPIFKPMKLFN